jgi:peroxiredoxin
LHRLREELERADVRVVALSADEEQGARSMRKEEDLHFPVLYGVDAEEAERTFGLYVGERDGRRFVQPTQFVLDPEGVVRLASYASGRTGRLSGDEALEEIESFRS